MSLFQRLQAWWRRRRGGPLPTATIGQPDPAVPAVDEVPALEVARDVDAAAGRAATRIASPAVRGALALRLALQGGGSHGAFTWGVLDRLLEREDIDIDAISGTSAGALNAAVLATGWSRNGRAGAREALARFWRDVGHAGGLSLPPMPGLPSPLPGLELLPGYDWGRALLRTLSPYDYNPLNFNPLRELVTRHVDVAALHAGPIRVFATATAVRSGQARVFSGDALDIDALLASACLPFLFQAVEIDGEPYWDGGYSGNPSLQPLLARGMDGDIVVVRINPELRERLPRRSAEIMDRIGEIGFNAGLIGELSAIALLQALLPEGAPLPRLHMIADDADLASLPASSRLRADPAFVERLFGLGRIAGERFFATHGDALGRCSSFDLASQYRWRGADASSAEHATRAQVAAAGPEDGVPRLAIPAGGGAAD